MSNIDRTSFSQEYLPSQEEDDKVLAATGYRYGPARARGLPFPWCAKLSGKQGWRVRAAPPLPNQRPDAIEDFHGWRAAIKMFRSREILLQRVEKTAGPKKPFKKRVFGSLDPASTNVAGKNAVEHWFRHTNRVVQQRVRQLKEEEFRAFLRAAVVKERKRQLEVRKTCRGNKREARERTKQTHNAAPLPPSPTRKKHKKMTPTRNQQSLCSISLGDDPQLDSELLLMIEDIVQEFIHEFPKEPEGATHTQTQAGAGHVGFDDSAVSALREVAKDAARENISMLLLRESASMTVASVDTERAPLVATSITSEAPLKTIGAIASAMGKNTSDQRVTEMVEQLIGEAAQDSTCQFDAHAVRALKEAATEIVEKERSVASSHAPREKGKDASDQRVTEMVEQLIREVAQDSTCRFDVHAVRALKEAATEIVEDERTITASHAPCEEGKDASDQRVTELVEQLIDEAAQDSNCQFGTHAVQALKEAATELLEDKWTVETKAEIQQNGGASSFTE